MKRVHLNAITIICIIALIIGLTGCARIQDKSDISENHPSTIGKTIETSIPDPAPATVMQTQPSSPSSGDNIKSIDYNQYLKKIWVVKSWDGEAYDYSFSFFITKIDNGVIEGKLFTRSIANPDFYFYSLEPSIYLGELSGIVNNGVAECQFSDKDGNKGNVTLVFKENNEIEATIKYSDKGEVYNDRSLDDKYLFRPYNLDDNNIFTPIKEHSFAIDLNSWGIVNFVSGESNTGDKVYPAFYLTNEHDDILYEFEAPFKVGSEIIEASIKDINKDGLKDVWIITDFIYEVDDGRIEWIFYQMEDGLFYSSNLESAK
jgi:hypothetical protein